MIPDTAQHKTATLPRRPARTGEVFGITCYRCEKEVEIAAREIIGLHARCRCGARLEILWRLGKPR